MLSLGHRKDANGRRMGFGIDGCGNIVFYGIILCCSDTILYRNVSFRRVILNKVKSLNTSTKCYQILRYAQYDTRCFLLFLQILRYAQYDTRCLFLSVAR